MIAIDGSETAHQALVEAENIANTYDATLCVVYSVVHTVDGDLEAARKIGYEILDQAKSSVSTLNTETRLLVPDTGFGLNSITEAIATAATDWDADLVVVGTANRRGLKRFFVGSVAEQLITKINSSMLLVRPPKA